MHQFSPTAKLMAGIARVELVWKLAGENAPLAAIPGNEALAQIYELAAEALLILNSLRGEIVGQP